jgi:hypothetical protein
MEAWLKVCTIDGIPSTGARLVRCTAVGDIALVRRAGGEIVALGVEDNRIHAPGRGCARRYAVRVDPDGSVSIRLPAAQDAA